MFLITKIPYYFLPEVTTHYKVIFCSYKFGLSHDYCWRIVNKYCSNMMLWKIMWHHILTNKFEVGFDFDSIQHKTVIYSLAHFIPHRYDYQLVGPFYNCPYYAITYVKLYLCANLRKRDLTSFFKKGDKKCINFFFLRTKFKLLLNDGFIFKMVFFTRSLTILWENNVNSMSNTDNFPVKNKISDDYICRLFSWIFG